MSNPNVTVLITTYNYGRFIEEAIDSVLAQDYPLEKIQIIVVDDGSTDDTCQRVRKYSSRLEYYQKPNGGQASALNFGLARARGEIVAPLDADDLFVPSKLRCITRAFQAHPGVGMVYHRTRLWKSDTNEYAEYELFDIVSGNIYESPKGVTSYITQPTTCVCFRRQSVSALLPIPENIRMNADCFLVALIPFLSPVLALPEVLSIYRVHGQNAYYAEEQQMPREMLLRRLTIWQTVCREMTRWVRANGSPRKSVRAFVDGWNACLERQCFVLATPGRFRYFRFVLLENRLSRPHQSWKLNLFNYMFSPVALILGYKRASRFYEYRRKALKTISGQ